MVYKTVLTAFQFLNGNHTKSTGKLYILPSMFGLCGVRPGAGGCDVRVWDGAILHPQGVTTLSCRGRMKGRRGGEKDRDMSNILICMEKMSGGNLIFPLECRQPSLVTEHNVVMSSLGKLPDFMLHNPHRHWGGGRINTKQYNKLFLFSDLLQGPS